MLQYASYGGLALALCELGLTLRGEIQYIWTNPRRFGLVRFLYLFSRYFALAAHIANCCLATIVLRHPTPTEKLCHYSLVYRAVVAFSMLGVLDAILMVRVYALYNRPTSMAIFFVFLLVGKVISATIAAYQGYPRLRFSPSCLVISKSLPAMAFFAGGELVLQLVILGFTISRHVSAARGGWSAPLVSLVSRQGSIVFSAITVAMVGVVVASQKPVDMTHVLFPILIIIMSTSGCRLILNMQRMAQVAEEPVFTTTRIWLDTVISLQGSSAETSTVKVNMNSMS